VVGCAGTVILGRSHNIRGLIGANAELIVRMQTGKHCIILRKTHNLMELDAQGNFDLHTLQEGGHVPSLTQSPIDFSNLTSLNGLIFRREGTVVSSGCYDW